MFAEMLPMKTCLTALIVILTFHSVAQDFEKIRTDLTDIFHKSHEVRRDVIVTIRKYGMGSAQMDSLNRLIQRHDSESLTKVIEIIEQYGWLGISEIGEVPNQAIFLVIQHAQDKSILSKYFPLLAKSAEIGESHLSSTATMHDRILCDNGEKQLYGTQSRMVNGKLELFPIEDPKNVNKRRRKVGLKKIDVN